MGSRPRARTLSTRRLTPESAKRVVENDEYAAFARRILRSYARRIAIGDIDALTQMTGLADDIETAIRAAVTGLRDHGYSWADIGARLGVTRQAAQQRWGRPVMTTTTTPDYYAILGLTQAATTGQIKKAYRKLARQHHPDMNNGDPEAAEQFRLITEAYDTLTDPERRVRYDASYQPSPATGVSGFDPGQSQAVSLSCASSKHAGRPSAPTTPRSRPSSSSSPAAPTASRPDGATTPPGAGTSALDERTEIMVSGEGLRRDPRSVLGTLLHEAAHALAAARGIQDTSRQGRYHNRKFQAHAAELGIDTEHDPKLGWSITTVPDPTASRYADQLAELEPP